MALTGKNISLPIYHNVNGVQTSFHDLVLRKFTVDSVVMSLGDKITGDVYYKDKNLECTMKEYVVFNDVEYTLVNPPTLVKEGMVTDNSDLKGMSKYSFEFYHPMYLLGNLPFTDVAVSYDEMRYKSQDKTFSWIGKPADFVAKLNKNLENTEWVVVLSSRFPQDKEDELSEVLSFDKNTIADVLKTGYETWGVPFVVDKLHQGEYYHTDANNNNVDYYTQGKRFVVVFGLPSNEIYASETDEQLNIPFVFRFGQGVGLKNHSRTPRNNKIVTRIAGYGSENNIPYGYPQIRWYGDPDATCTIGDSVGAKQNVTINGTTYSWAMSYPIYEGIVGGEWVKLIKHPFTRNHLMPTIYANGVFNKVSQFLSDGSANPNYNPDIEIKDYYDAIEGEQGYDYENLINPVAPSYEIHEFDDIKPELGEAYILGATPINADLTDADGWDDTMDDDGNYLQSYFKITLPQLTFDIYACAAITQEMEINMRSGACIGCTFTVQVDWEDYKRNFYDSEMNFAPNGEQRDYTRYPDSSQGSITVVVQKDINTFGTLMPNIYQNPHVGDAFVVLGISLPLSYITSAQERLDDAMKSFMLGNNVYYFDYPLKFDEYMLANNTNILNQIRPNTIIRFEFNDETLELFVKQLTIKFNENTLPQYDITLTDNIEVVLNQIGQVAEDVERLGTLIALLRQNYNKNAWAEIAKKLSKVSDDTAAGLITFAKGWETLGFLSNNFLGYGAKVDVRGVGEFEEINIRGALRAAELVFNRISAEEGESIRSIGHGEILTVTPTGETTGTATLKLDGDEWANIETEDICRGLYNTINKGYDNANDEGFDDNGFRLNAGFFASYFEITSVTSSKGECSFTYRLQEGTTEHPCPLMKFAVYGNFNRQNVESKKKRQSSIYTTSIGIAPRQLFLAGVNDWLIKPQNIKLAKGNIDGIKAWEIVSESEYEDDGSGNWKTETRNGETVYMHLKELHGDAGFYCEDNIYLGGIIDQFKSAALDVISSEISNLGQSYVWTDVSSFIVDCNSSGKVLSNTAIDINAKLYFGNQICTLTEAKFNGVNADSLTESNKNAVYSRTIAANTTNFQSYTITVSLKGTYNGVEYTSTKTINVFANKQGTQGNTGGGAAWIDALPSAIAVECNSDGTVVAQQNETITAAMYIGTTVRMTLSTKTAVYQRGSNNYEPTIRQTSENDGVITWGIVFPATQTPLTNSSILLTFSGGGYTATKSIPIIPIRQGAQGESVGGYSAQITHSSDNVVVDNIGNIIGGLNNRLFTEVNIWDAQGERSLTYQSSGTLQDGTFGLSIVASGCTASAGNDGKVSISAIANPSIVDSCYVTIIATTFDGAVFRFVYTITLTHIDKSYLTFYLDNEYDSMAYRTQTSRYDGLPISATLNVYANDIENIDGIAEYGNVRIYNTPSIGYIKKTTITSDLFGGSITATATLGKNGSGEVISVSHQTSNSTIYSGDVNTGLRVSVNSGGVVTINHRNQTSAEIDLDDAKHWFDITCDVVYGGVTYVSPTKRLTVSEVTDSTIYKMLLSATAISQEETTYTPSSIDVTVSVTDDNGTSVYTPNATTGNVIGNIYVKYIDGTYNTSGVNTLLDTCPSPFSQLSGNVFTVVLVDLADSSNPIYLDIQTITINKGGKDGAGQSWISASHDQFVVDCESNGAISNTKELNLTASLKWGDDVCRITSATIDTSNLSNVTVGSTNGIGTNQISKKITFIRGNLLSSTQITITIVGTDNNNNSHTATKTVAIIAQRKGDSVEGDEGRGIVSMVTYYQRNSLYEGVEPPSTNAEPTENGWNDTYIEPTASEPYLWRFTRTTYTKGQTVEQTDAELIKVYSDTPNYNLLDDTSFGSLDAMDAWVEKGKLHGYGNITPAQYVVSAQSGIFKVQFMGYQGDGGENGYIQFLTQPLYTSSEIHKIETNRWYTISFYLYGNTLPGSSMQSSKHFYLDLSMGSMYDPESPRYVDGALTTSDSTLHFTPTTTLTRHIVTFKTPSSFSSDVSLNFNMYTTYFAQYIQMSKPKLEIGMVATEYTEGGSSLGISMARTSTWQLGKDYYKGSQGERWLDYVAFENRWFQCIKSHTSNNSNKPNLGSDNEYWKQANNFSFVATDILLADQAVIRLFQSQKILMTNDKNQLTASLNYDGDGGYCIYYPASGNKMMEFSSDGYIKYYRDEAGDDSLEWKLGFGGTIIGHNSDDWKPIMLYKLVNNTPSFTSDTTFNRTTYYEFVDGDLHNYATYDGAIYSSHTNNDPTNLTSNLAASTGWYTPNTTPWQAISDDGETTLYAITMYRIVRSSSDPKIAKIAKKWTRYFDGEEYYNEQDS